MWQGRYRGSKKNMNYKEKHVILKYNPIVYTTYYDQDVKSKDKEDIYKLFYYGKATIKNWFHFILISRKRSLYQSSLLKVDILISNFWLWYFSIINFIILTILFPIFFRIFQIDFISSHLKKNKFQSIYQYKIIKKGKRKF